MNEAWSSSQNPWSGRLRKLRRQSRPRNNFNLNLSNVHPNGGSRINKDDIKIKGRFAENFRKNDRRRINTHPNFPPFIVQTFNQETQEEKEKEFEQDLEEEDNYSPPLTLPPYTNSFNDYDSIFSYLSEMNATGQMFPQFMTYINTSLHIQNGDMLKNLLPIEPPFKPDYIKLLKELSIHSIDETIKAISLTTQHTTHGEWNAFVDFLAHYFQFIGTVNVENLLETYEKLTELLTKCTAALQADPFGIIILPTILEYSKVLSRLAIGLDKRPELISHLLVTDDGSSQSLAERAAMKLRPIMSICARDPKPDGKSSAVYKLANLCMKILFQCKKPESIPNFYQIVALQKRPITDYHAAERVTYLYYLGKYYYSSAQFFTACRVLEQAYTECDTRVLKNRRLILIYLVASNIILGRFPTSSLYQRPEARGFAQKFHPICTAMKSGDLSSFRMLTSTDSPSADWFLYFGILLQIQSRGEVLVWRSLARRTFAIRAALSSNTDTLSNSPSRSGGATINNRGQSVAPTLDLKDLHALMSALAIRSLSPLARSAAANLPGQRHTAWALFPLERPTDLPSPHVDEDFDGVPLDQLDIIRNTLPTAVPTLAEVEGIVVSLIAQGLMNGFLSHRQQKFAVRGARDKPALTAGWPAVAKVIWEKHDGDVVGGLSGGAQAGQGMKIQLQSAAAVG